MVLITGASRGIGQAIAVEAAEAGAEGIVLAARWRRSPGDTGQRVYRARLPGRVRC